MGGSPDVFKIPGKEGYLTRGELAKLVRRDRKRITQLEREGRIPAPIRVRAHKQVARLYSPEQVETIVRFFRENGRPVRRQHWKKPNDRKGMSKRLRA